MTVAIMEMMRLSNGARHHGQSRGWGGLLTHIVSVLCSKFRVQSCMEAMFASVQAVKQYDGGSLLEQHPSTVRLAVTISVVTLSADGYWI